MSTTRRRLLTTSVGLSTPFLGSAVAARRGVTFAGFTGLFQELYEPLVLDPFTRSRADLGVFYAPFPGSTQILATLRRQREQPQLDVVLLELAAARAATDEGLLEPLTQASLPVLAELAPAATFPGIAGRALYTEPLVMLFDATQTRAPPLWKVLWSRLGERFIALPAPPDPVGIAFTIVAGRLFGGGNESRAVDNGIIAINELSGSVASWNPPPDVYHYIGDGNARLGVGWNLPAQVFSDRLSGRLGVAFPNEGTISRVVTVNLVKGSREPDAARLLIANMLGADAQKTMVERMFLGPVNARARYDEAALFRTANTPERAAAAMPVDWVAVEAIRESIIRRWRERIPDAG